MSAPATTPATTTAAQPRSRLGDQLLQSGLVTQTQLRQALELQNKRDIKLGEALVTLGYVSEDQIEELLGAARNRFRLGDLLVAQKLIKPEQLQEALVEQKKSGEVLGRIVVRLGFITEPELLRFLSKRLNVPYVDLRALAVDESIARKLPEENARRFRAMPLALRKDGVVVGMADPSDLFALDEIGRILRGNVLPAIVSEMALIAALDKLYRKTESLQNLAEELGQEVSRSRFDLQALVQSEELVDAPVVKILQSLFQNAVETSASDIHIEPDEEMLRIRQRIDGMLHEQVIRENHIAPALISKLKLMAGLEISEKRRPQDGRFNMTVGGRSIDVRVSTLPITHGESVVMRVLDQSMGMLKLEQTGLDELVLARFRSLIQSPHGIVLVTGPTGSGKTTTLYAALNQLNQPERKIITAEDPVEYRLKRVNQVQINAQIGLTFAAVLRSILRQDPDVVLVGEMRDKETSEIAIRAALTGHLVLSTLHTNDAVGAAVRLVEMGTPGYLVASSVRGVLAQRLIRRICSACAHPAQPEESELNWVKAVRRGGLPKQPQWRVGQGCDNCHHTGYQGRLAVAELLEIKGAFAEALRKEDFERCLQVADNDPDYRPLHLSALALAEQGVTTLAEAIRLHSAALDAQVSDDADEEEHPSPEATPPEESASDSDSGDG
ncbi:GspE/PulE family protein [Magnetofaba australis]|uniref:Putative type II secretion system protein E n=1 Tax=Magnetofaba australis IT-1 TaxID=1434232 RepID=A0A1Y2K224_9PROT|nr:GspE/PulE family protein [Magnetofaba australis]OSM01707.1 putative type II secretion system protein E [Magnetofaba australis IT-1]